MDWLTNIKSPFQWLPNNGLNKPVLGAGGIVNIVLQAAFYMSGVVAVFYIVVGAYNYMQSAGDDSQVKNAKNGIKYALMGLAVMILALALRNAVNTILI